MSTDSKKLLVKTLILILGVYIFVLWVAYALFKGYAIEENEAKLQDLVMHNKALHTYVEEQIKPVIYKLKEEAKIEKDYFEPKILSFTYMSRKIMDEYNKQRASNNIETIAYKFASQNPRNPINKADENEEKILKTFNAKEITKYHEHIEEDGKEYIFYAMPVATNVESCMRCHSEPKNAPKSLIERYGDKAGFYEKVGDIRAFMSVTMPLEVELKKTHRMITLFAVILFTLLLAVFGVIFYFIKQLDTKDTKLLEQANKDALTKIYNRHVFNQDIEKMNPQRKNISQFLIILDIDHFKNVNDTYGHSTGDNVLIRLSEIISKSIREHDKFYRIGGEEFAIISLDATLDGALEFSERLRKEIKASSFDKIGSLTVSIGISQLTKDDTGGKLFDKADKALYNAKENGRDQVQVFVALE